MTIISVLCVLYLLARPAINTNPPDAVQNVSEKNDSAGDIIGINNSNTLLNTIPYLRTFWSKVKNLAPLVVNGWIKDKKCIQDIFYAFQNLLAGEMWAIQMLDAQWKPPPGALMGNKKWLGNEWECARVYAPPKNQSNVGNFHGRFCRLNVAVENQNPVELQLGICLPDSCNAAEVGADMSAIATNLKSMVPFLSSLQSPVHVNSVECSPILKPLSPEARLVLQVIAFFALLTAIGSSLTVYKYLSKMYLKQNLQYHYTLQKNEEFDGKEREFSSSPKQDNALPSVYTKQLATDNWEGTRTFFNCFCLFTNAEKLFNTDAKEGQLEFLHGFRFLSLCWIILCHLCVLSLPASSNPVQLLSFGDTWSAEIVLNGFFSIDSFLFMSGFLLGYVFFRECAKTGGILSWPFFYIHRYSRLTPSYMMVLGIFTTTEYYILDGVEQVVPLCKNYWAWNLLYINNFLDDWCVPWSWYLALDMQLFAISPLFLITLWRWPKIGYHAIAICVIACSIISFAVSYNYEIYGTLSNAFQAYLKNGEFYSRYSIFFNKLYDKPYTRISPYVIGIALAHYLHQHENNPPRPRTVPYLLGWIASTVTALAVICGMFHQGINVLQDSVYHSVSHVLFSLCLVWIFYTCCLGLEPVKTILSWKIFIPFSRLTYSAYLCHCLVIQIYIRALEEPLVPNRVSLIVAFLGLLPVIYVCAFSLSMLFEAPVLRLEKLLTRKMKKC